MAPVRQLDGMWPLLLGSPMLRIQQSRVGQRVISTVIRRQGWLPMATVAFDTAQTRRTARAYPAGSTHRPFQGEPHEHRNRAVDRFDPDTDWRHSDVAAQQELGLRSQRRIGVGGNHPPRAAIDGKTVMRVDPALSSGA